MASLLKLVVSLPLLGGLAALMFRSHKYKKSILENLARSLGAEPLDSGVIGAFKDIQYVIYFDEGSVIGPMRPGSPSSMRVVVQKPGAGKLWFHEDGRRLVPANIANAHLVEQVAQKLFAAGFKEIEYDGKMLDITMCPASLNDQSDAKFFERILPLVSDLVESLDKDNPIKRREHDGT